MSPRTPRRRSPLLATAVAVVVAVVVAGLGGPGGLGGAAAGPGDTVHAPGPVSWRSDGDGVLRLGDASHVLRGARTPPECSDGKDNDDGQDGRIDFDGGFRGRALPTTDPDTGCAPGAGVGAETDDDEARGGHQPKTFFAFDGAVAADGSFRAPAAAVRFPTDHVYRTIVVSVEGTATSDVEGTWDPAGHASLELSWELRITGSFFGTGGPCAAPLTVALSTDAAAAVNAGPLPVAPSAPGPHDGSAVLTGNTFAVGPMRPVGYVEGTTGAAAAGSTTFVDPGASFVAADRNKHIVIEGARADGTDLRTRIAAVVDATTVVLQAPPDRDVNPATYRYATTDQGWCDTMGAAAGLTPGVGSPAGENSLELPLRPDPALTSGTAGGPLAGTVTDAATGDPLEGVVVSVLAPHPAWTLVGTAVTGPDGTYQLPWVNDGDYQLRYFSPAGTHQRTWYGATLTYLRGVTVSASGGAAGVDQALQPTPAGSIAGRVTVAGAPRSGIAVRIYHPTDGFVAGVLTGADGWYRLRGVPAGSYLVQFVDPTGAHRQQWFRQAALAPDAEPVVVGSSTAWAGGWLEPVG